MQIVNQEQPASRTTDDTSSVQVALSLEAVAYLLFIGLALALWLGQLSAVPMTDLEASRALPAWQMVNPDAPGTPQPATSPVVFWLQAATFSVLGATEFAARLPGVLGGLLLMLLPLLWRQHIGAGRAFLMSVLLALSPVVMMSARTADPVLWASVFTLFMLWALWHYVATENQSAATLTGVGLAGLLFLSAPGGLWLLLILLLAGGGALWWSMLAAPDERDSPGDDLWYTAKRKLLRFPRARAFAALVLTVFLVATGFMLYPGSLQIVGQGVGAAFAGLTQSAQPNAPGAFPLLVLLTYNPLLIAFGAVASGVIILRGADFTERFAILWLALMALFLAVVPGAMAAHALWLVLPLVYLVACLAVDLFEYHMPPLFWMDEWFEEADNYAWMKWVVASVTVILFFMLTVHLGEIGRGLVNMPSQWSLNVFSEARFNEMRYSILWVLITLMFGMVLYLLSSSLFGRDNALQGAGIGVLVFMLGAGVASGWNASVENVTHPPEVWHVNAVSPDAVTLRETLHDLDRRSDGGLSLLPVTVVTDAEAGLTDDGLVAWLLRDFENARFTDSVDIASRDEVILLPAASDDDPELGGSYVGQSVTLRQAWSVSSLRGQDVLAWWLQRSVPQADFDSDTAVLWVRMDVYDAIPADERPQQ